MVAQSTTLALTTTATLFNQFSTLGALMGPGTGSDADGNVSIRADLGNNRLLCVPGIYEFIFEISGLIATTANLVAQFRRNGTVVTGSLRKALWTQTTENTLSMHDIITVTTAHIPGTISDFPDTSTTGFAGASGAPKNSCAIDVMVAAGGSYNLTAENVLFYAKRLG